MKRHLVLAIYDDEPTADAAVQRLNTWAGQEAAATMVDTDRWLALGILVLDEKGDLKSEKLGPRHTLEGAGIGLVLVAVAPVGLVVGVVGGALLGAHHRTGLGLSDDDRDRIGRELQGGKAAVGVLTDETGVESISAKLVEFGGAIEAHNLDDAALAQLDATAAATPAESPDASVE